MEGWVLLSAEYRAVFQELSNPVADVVAVTGGAADIRSLIDDLLSTGDVIEGGKELERAGFRDRGCGFREDGDVVERTGCEAAGISSVLSGGEQLN